MGRLFRLHLQHSKVTKAVFNAHLENASEASHFYTDTLTVYVAEGMKFEKGSNVNMSEFGIFFTIVSLDIK